MAVTMDINDNYTTEYLILAYLLHNIVGLVVSYKRHTALKTVVAIVNYIVVVSYVTSISDRYGMSRLTIFL